MTHALRQDDEQPDELDDDLDEEDEDAGGEDLEEVEGDDARVEAAFQPEDHPRAPAGTGNGGEFTGGGSDNSSKTKAPKRQKKRTNRRGAPSRPNIPDGQLGFDGKTGTGYGGSDAHVEELQDELNRLHIGDDKHHKLRKDGQFGPLTTQAVKEAQRRLGMNPTGVVSPAFIDRLKSLASLPKPRAKRTTAAALADIELARPGTWDLASGTTTFTVEMLQDAARYAQKHATARSALKLGHVDPRFDGEPAFGWLNNADIFLDEDDQGPVLKARKLDGLPDWLATTARDAWPNRSVEGWLDYEDKDGEKFGLVLDGLALLGVTPPGISSIRSLRDLPAALGVAASAPAQRVVARAPGASPAARVAATAPASEAEEPVKKGAGMDPAKIREACGLPADASDDEVKSTLAAAGLVPAAPEPVAASIKDAPGIMRIDASAWNEREERIQRLEAQLQKQRESERDDVIAKAVQAGKFAPSRKQHWQRLWDADPEGAREIIASLQPNVIPTAELGFADGADEPDEYASLFAPARKAG